MGMDLQPAALQHISFLVHNFLAFQIGQDLTKDKFDTTKKKHADSVLFTSVTCLLLPPELWMLATASRHMTIEHRNERRETEEHNRTTSLQDLLSAMAEDVLSLLGCARGMLKHPWAFLLEDLRRQHSLAIAVCHCMSACGKTSSLENTKKCNACSGTRQLSLIVWPDPPEGL